MNQSLTNRIIANIKQTSLTNTNFIRTAKCNMYRYIKRRIGINTKNPQYSIDISNKFFTILEYIVFIYKMHINNIEA